MNEAIKLAIEKGGYNSTVLGWGQISDKDIVGRGLILDPLFWQALGKALGWKRELSQHWDIVRPEWLNKAMTYYEINLTGGDTEKFFKKLIKN